MYIEISARKQTMYGEHPSWPPELRKITLLKRGDFKTNEFLKPNSLVAFLIKAFKTPMDVILSPLNTLRNSRWHSGWLLDMENSNCHVNNRVFLSHEFTHI